MRKIFANIVMAFMVVSCTNTPELETGEIKSLNLLKQSFENLGKSKVFVDSRILLSRKQIDAAGIPVLFVELKSGQNGTLTPYPGQGIGKTWLGADGATITLEQGILKATRGMGDDLMASHSLIPSWSKIGFKVVTYTRHVNYLTGENKLVERVFKCSIKKYKQIETLEIWGLKYQARKFEENCHHNNFEIVNTYYLDDKEIVRKSFQYHSDTIGYITIERLDRL